jgi:outer membrane protein OmpA-like peptidoglycan-associated protein
MRSKSLLIAPILFAAGCYKSSGPQTAAPVPLSWSAPVYRWTPVPPPAPEPAPAPVAEPAPPPEEPKTELSDNEIKLREKVQFETDSATIKPESYPLLDQVAQVMKDHPEVEHVRVGGHTDNQGTPQHNMKLSEARAAAVKQYLVDHGVEADRLDSKGYGQTHPIGDNATEEGRAQNRRVSIHIRRRQGDTKDRADSNDQPAAK